MQLTITHDVVDAVMTPDPWVIPENGEIVEVARLMDTHQIRHVPVVDGAGRLSGMVYDYVVDQHGMFVGSPEPMWLVLDPIGPKRLAGDLARPVHVVAVPETPLAPALRRMLSTAQDVLVVTDVARHPVGIVTEHDVVRFAADVLPRDLGTTEHGSAPVHRIDGRRPISEALAQMAARGIRHLVVSDEGRFHGVVSYRDLVGRRVPGWADGRVFDAQRSGPTVVLIGDRPLHAVIGAMLERKIGCVPILDPSGQPMRIVTRSDVVRAVCRFSDAR